MRVERQADSAVPESTIIGSQHQNNNCKCLNQLNREVASGASLASTEAVRLADQVLRDPGTVCQRASLDGEGAAEPASDVPLLPRSDRRNSRVLGRRRDASTRVDAATRPFDGMPAECQRMLQYCCAAQREQQVRDGHCLTT